MTVEIKTSKFDGKHRASFTIGVQTFYLREAEDEDHAMWFCNMLEKAFKSVGLKTKIEKDENTDKHNKENT